MKHVFENECRELGKISCFPSSQWRSFSKNLRATYGETRAREMLRELLDDGGNVDKLWVRMGITDFNKWQASLKFMEELGWDR